MVGNPNESTVTEERGREAAPTNLKKKRDQSKACEGNSLELMVAEFGERLERVQYDFKTLEDHVLEQVDALKGSVEETRNEVEARDYEEKKKAFVPKGGCFLCKGSNPMSSCPKLGSLSAIIDRQDTESQAEMGSLQVLNALKAKSLTPTPSNGPMYVEAVINEKLTRAMVDTGATHNFVSKDEANRLGLKYTGSTRWLKTVNIQAVPLHGVARGVELRLGTWKGQVKFSVVPMDDFKVVLGLDFLRQDFLAEFDYTLEYKPGKANVVVDALSRKAELVAISLAKGTVLERIKEGLEQDPMTRELVKLASDGKTQRFWVEDGLLYTKGRRIYVPKWENLWRDLIKECHDTKWAGHPGQKRTMALLEIAYFWPYIKNSVELYVKTSLVCQQDKIENRKPTGLLEPLPVPQRPWDSITLDFINALPKSEGYVSIIVVVDRFSKYETFIPCPKDCTTKEAARAFFKNVVKHWGLPRSIISDRDPRFIGRLWTKLFKLLGAELNFSTSFHPQIDGQTERVNALLECYLRHFMSANQRDWPKLLDVTQFSYNLQRSEATGRSPFELATGQQPLTAHTLTMPLDEGKNPGATKMAKSWEKNADIARTCLEKARKKMKWADEKRRHREFTIGDLVLVKLFPQ
ncbi:hypothetical protein F3Y22_tig00117000pilonHSYRG00231 [Hibiscus syriacus]|uniref:Integrase catalytic domain-containing protein n=1 Tax=Hibiscus syriacus TaxID=106335 RepID=A0A6A2WKB8_HIBSY|nr:hypothetical protein F3Y22_tig00117000pilonHSYRG00231 [Hibiscus syriacus]